MEKARTIEKVNENREQYSSIASSIYNFFLTLPDIYLRFVYREIVENSFRLAELYPYDDVRTQLVEAICENYEIDSKYNENLPLFSKWAREKTPEHYAKIKKALNERDCYALSGLLNYDIVNKSDVILLYDLFVIDRKVVGNDAKGFNSQFSQRLKTLNDDLINHSPDQNRFNSFRMLGFLSFVSNFLSSDPESKSSSAYSFYFYNDYCLGFVLDYLLDTIYRCNVTMIAKGLRQHVIKIASEDRNFKDIIQERFNRYRYIYPQIPDYDFVFIESAKCNELKDDEAVALPELMHGKESVSYEQLTFIHTQLITKGYLDCEDKAFTNNLFSGIAKRTSKIVWLGPANSLAVFLDICLRYTKNMYKKDYFKLACSIFIDRNNKPFKPDTLIQCKGKNVEDLKLDFEKNIFQYAFRNY